MSLPVYSVGGSEKTLERRDSSQLTLTVTVTDNSLSSSTSRKNSAYRYNQRPGSPYPKNQQSTSGRPQLTMGKLTRTAKASRRYFFQEVDSSYMSLVLIVCFFVSGLVDSVAFNTWSCFVNMQSGNTIFAALGLGGQPRSSHKQHYYKSLTAIGAFCIGSLFFNALHRYSHSSSSPPSPLRRLTLIASFLIQTIFIAIAASLVSTNTVSDQPFIAGTFSSGTGSPEEEVSPTTVNFLDLCPIALLSFQAPGQVTLSRLLALVELPTIVVSTLYHDFCANLLNTCESWRKSSSVWEFVNVYERRQQVRAACIVALFVGGIVGGEMYKTAAGMGGVLWLAAALKFSVVMAWFCWRQDREQQDGETSNESSVV